MIELFKSLHYMDPEAESHCQTHIHELVLRGLKIMNFLMNIKGFGYFDCQSCFMSNEGLKILFGISSYIKNSLSPIYSSQDSKMFTDIKI